MVAARSKAASRSTIEDRMVYVYWVNEDGKTGTVATSSELGEIKLNIRSFAEGFDHTVVVSSMGRVRSLGCNKCGQFGTGDTRGRKGLATAKMPWVAGKVTCGQSFSVAVRHDGGAVATWGLPELGRLGRGGDPILPTKVAGLPLRDDPVVLAETGTSYTFVVLSSGDVWAWGDNAYGELAMSPHGEPQPTPVRVANLCGRSVVRLSAGFNFGVAETKRGELLGWGLFRPNVHTSPVRLDTKRLVFPLRSMAASMRHIVVADANGFVWGRSCDAPAGTPWVRNRMPYGERGIRVAAASSVWATVISVTLTMRGHLWDTSTPELVRAISWPCPELRRSMDVFLPYGGASAINVVLVPERCPGRKRLIVFLLIAGRLGLLPNCPVFRRRCLFPTLMEEEFIDDKPLVVPPKGEGPAKFLLRWAMRLTLLGCYLYFFLEWTVTWLYSLASSRT
eukprot:TRINITY_DN70818_c0_g1_i1.p1 TRINITY_DN70818_c0_g1~~TRINITY_DN70818_c0_g1_i1.p1  ORF type:complete len:450 (+),score=77.33 TRINITY_DN70818_c0_g1_i1:93-1442(+)